MKTYEDLLMQYKRATGIKCENEFDKNFKVWLENYSMNLEEYINLLKSQGYDFNKTNFAELDKGAFDSILVRCRAKNIEDRLITENAELLKISKRRIKIDKNQIKIYHNGQLFPIQEYEGFMSYNLHKRNSLERFSIMHNLRQRVLYGVFGNKCDLDKRQKLEDVQSIYKNMKDEDFDLNYYETPDSYFYYVASKDELNKGIRMVHF